MKKLLFSLIATGLLSNVSFGQDFDSFGLEHNRILNSIISNLKVNTTREEFVSEMKIAVYKTVPKETADYAYSVSDNSLDAQFRNGLISKEAYDLMKVTENKFQLTKNINETLNLVDEMKSYLSSLNEKDKTQFQNYLSTLKHSSLFWEDIKNSANDVNSKICYKCIAQADANGAASASNAFFVPHLAAIASALEAAHQIELDNDAQYIPIPKKK